MGIKEVAAHPWFADIDMEKLLKCKIDPPFKPQLSANAFDVSNFDAAFTNEEAIISVVQAKNQQKVQKHADDFKDFC